MISEMSKRIDSEIYKMNLTNEKLAILLDVESRTVSKWRRGITIPRKHNIVKLSKIFNCKVEWIINGEL